MKYIDAEKLKAEIKRRIELLENGTGNPEVMKRVEGVLKGYNSILSFIDSLQQEPTPDTDVLHTKLVNLLKTYRIGEETAITLADRIADTYGVQRYMDGLCNEMDKEDTKQEQTEDIVVVARTFLDALSKTPYNNKPITDAQIIVKQLLLFFDSPASYNPDAIVEQPEGDLEKEIEWEWVHREKQEVDLIECAEMDKEEFARFARHFWNKGYNARKP